MSNAHFFLVNYILKDQPKSARVRSGTETLSCAQARIYVEALHAVNAPGLITDIEVIGLHHRRENQYLNAASHYQCHS